MTETNPTKAQIFEAFDYIHNKNMEGDIYLPCDAPQVAEDIEAAEDGVWVHHCRVWISFDDVRDALKDKARSTPTGDS